jgi:HEPN domain-containing protein
MRSREHAELLLRKASQDIYVLEKLSADPATPDEILGFHAQQAAEKMLKAALTNRAIRYGRTHDLTDLLRLLHLHQLSLPADLEEIKRLTPFASEFRYTELPVQHRLDRSWALDIVRRVKAWAETVIGVEPEIN